MQYHADTGVNLTLFNDHKVMLVADNDFQAGLTETWIEHANPDDSDDESEEFELPLPVSRYKQSMHYADRKNQHLGYQGTEHKCQRKYNSLAFKMMELFGLDNPWIVWHEKKGLLGDPVKTQHERYGARRCRDELFRKWAKECCLLNPVPKLSTHINASDIAKAALPEKMVHENQQIGPGRGYCRNCPRFITRYFLGCSMAFGRIIRICDECWDEVHAEMRSVPTFNSKG